MARMGKGGRIIATRDGKSFKQGAVAILDRVECIDSEDYVFATLLDGTMIGPSYDGYWCELDAYLARLRGETDPALGRPLSAGEIVQADDRAFTWSNPDCTAMGWLPVGSELVGTRYDPSVMVPARRLA